MRLSAEKKAQLTGHNAAIFALTGGENANEFISGAGDGWIVRWNLDDPEMGRLMAKVETQIFSLLYLPDRSTVVVGNMNGGVHWVDLLRPENNRNIAHHQKGVFGMCRIEDSVLTIGGDGVITRWSADSFRTVESLQLTNQSLRSIDFHSGRNELAVGASDNTIYLLDAATLGLKRQLSAAHDNSVFTVRYAADGQRLLSGGRDAHLKVWDLENDCRSIFDEPAHWFTINDIAFHPNGQWFATGSRDKSIKIWDAHSFQLLKVLEGVRDGGHFNSVNRLFWSAHEGQLISGSDDRSMIIWRFFQDAY